MLIRNRDIRKAKGSIPKWIIAEGLGIHENTLNLWMRQEMNAERKRRILAVINKIKTEIEVENNENNADGN